MHATMTKQHHIYFTFSLYTRYSDLIMSAQETVPQEPLRQPPVEQAAVPLYSSGAGPIPPEHAAMYLLGNAGKMVTLLAFYSLGERPGTSYALKQRIGQMQEGAQETWQPHTTLIESYCEDAFLPTKLIEYANQGTDVAEGRKYKTAMRLNEKGLTLGMGVVGALTAVELRTLTQKGDEANKRLPLPVAIGRTMLTKNGVQGAPTRFAVFESLLDNPAGVAHGELQARANITSPATVRLMARLMELNLITKHQDYGGNRPFKLLPELTQRKAIRATTPHAKVIVETLVRLQAAGTKELTGEEIINHIMAAQPDFDQQEVNTIFRQWCFKHRSLLSPANTQSELVRYTLNDEYRAFIQELVDIKRNLVKPDPKAEAWRQKSWQYAVELTRKNRSNAKKIALLMTSVRASRART